MTTEIAVFNSNGIALAADSAVSSFQGQKVYNSANKLFTLSKYHPVAIMIYNAASLTGVPWEVIIKEYRSYIGENSFPELKDYAMDFWNFIDSKKNWFPESVRDRAIAQKLRAIWQETQDELFKLTQVSDNNDDIKGLFESKIETSLEIYEKLEFLENFHDDDISDILGAHTGTFVEVYKGIFEATYDLLDADYKEKLERIAALSLVKSKFDTYSGIVFAGFGSDEITPKIASYQVGIFANNKLRKVFQAEKSNVDEAEFTPKIIPFAQDEVIWTFLRGVAPSIDDFTLGIFDLLPDLLTTRLRENALTGMAPVEKQALSDKIHNDIKALSENLIDRYNHESYRHGTEPILSMLSLLPKEELAEMAETLVHLTAFKLRMSAKHHTVGGPIDVAIISRGDGFIWVNRKHYFKQELNPHFTRTYFRD